MWLAAVFRATVRYNYLSIAIYFNSYFKIEKDKKMRTEGQKTKEKMQLLKLNTV